MNKIYLNVDEAVADIPDGASILSVDSSRRYLHILYSRAGETESQKPSHHLSADVTWRMKAYFFIFALGLISALEDRTEDAPLDVESTRERDRRFDRERDLLPTGESDTK
jgi:hypothetical protein